MKPAQELSYGWDFTCQQGALVIVTTRVPFFPATSLITTKKQRNYEEQGFSKSEFCFIFVNIIIKIPFALFTKLFSKH